MLALTPEQLEEFEKAVEVDIVLLRQPAGAGYDDAGAGIFGGFF